MGNKGAPSLVVASVYPDSGRDPRLHQHFIATIDHRTPFEQRWGGWYVTGTHGASGTWATPSRRIRSPLDLQTERARRT